MGTSESGKIHHVWRCIREIAGHGGEGGGGVWDLFELTSSLSVLLQPPKLVMLRNFGLREWGVDQPGVACTCGGKIKHVIQI